MSHLINKKLIEQKLSRCPTWASVKRRFSRVTVREFSQCGRCIEIKLPECECLFIIRDGAHNLFTVDVGC
jgi:hypothetical protein